MTDNAEPAGTEPAGSPMAISWPFVATLAIVLAATLAAPRLGASPGEVLAAVGAAGGLGALVYGRQAAKQTNGSLTARMDSAVQRGTAEIRAELPELIRQALDTRPERSPWDAPPSYPRE